MAEITRHPPLRSEDFKVLPEPVSLDETVTSEDALEVSPEPNEELREVQWMLRTAGGL